MHGDSFRVFFENPPHSRSSSLVNLVFVVWLPAIANYFHTVIECVFSVIGHSTHDIFTMGYDKGCCHGFIDTLHQNLCRFVVIRDRFGNVDDFNTALPQVFLGNDRINTVSGKTVCFPKNQVSGAQHFNLVEHQLKSWPVVSGATISMVIVFFDNVVAMRFCVVVRRLFLLGDADISLCVRTIAIIANGIVARILDKSGSRSHIVSPL